MTDADTLYRELKPQIELLANALFDASRTFVKKRGAFLPHGALLTDTGDVRLVMALPDNQAQDLVSAIDVLPNLHQALRNGAAQEAASGLAVCEDVSVTMEGQRETRAIKVLIEHRRGLCVALYMPFRRGLCGYSFGEIFAAPANAEVNAWPSVA
jgi:hypothetical protein